MCYTVFLSTTSPEDLSALPSPLYRFVRTTEADDQAVGSLLEHPHRWYLTSQYGGCSCHFRHLSKENAMVFTPPEDWCPEDAEDVEATGAVYDALFQIVEEGHRLDLVDMWEGTEPGNIRDLTVSLREVSRDAFQFFENHRFVVIA